MASPSTVISLGYGSWGSANLLPTLGYGISAAAASVVSRYNWSVTLPDAPEVDAVIPSNVFNVSIPATEFDVTVQAP